MDNKVHVFEQVKLGKAPFVFESFFIGNATYDPLNPNMQYTACQYCYTPIVNCFKIKSADGKSFIVGSECVKKTGDKGLIDIIKREINRRKAIEFNNKWQELRAKILAKDTEIVEKLDAQKHPWKDGLTMFDYADYLARGCAYDTSKKRIFKALK
jgi:hypothetical protein